MKRRADDLVIEGRLARAGLGDEEQPSARVFKALGSEPRLAILRHLGHGEIPVGQIAERLRIPPSTVNRHIAILEDAGLIECRVLPASRGLQKVCARRIDTLVVEMAGARATTQDVAVMEMPIGGYTTFEVEPPCGLAGASALIGLLDDPTSFYDPGRLTAGLAWFRAGYLEYRFPCQVPHGARVTSLELTVEVCSEAPLHALDWPSDIGVTVNETALGEWTSPGDFGGRRGYLTPPWWTVENSQYGLQKRWHVGPRGTTLDGTYLSGIRIDDLGVHPRDPIVVRIGVRPDARHVGGLNLFGRGFGNYPHDIVLTISYERGGRPGPID